jgi:hypothetical protein
MRGRLVDIPGTGNRLRGFALAGAKSGKRGRLHRLTNQGFVPAVQLRGECQEVRADAGPLVLPLEPLRNLVRERDAPSGVGVHARQEFGGLHAFVRDRIDRRAGGLSNVQRTPGLLFRRRGQNPERQLR